LTQRESRASGHESEGKPPLGVFKFRLPLLRDGQENITFAVVSVFAYLGTELAARSRQR
jgi:hypothetical protein